MRNKKELEQFDESTVKRRPEAKEKTTRPTPPDLKEDERAMHAEQWKPPAEFDAKIREWMTGQGWKANATRDYFDEEVYAWRHDTASGSSPTLWIARTVIEAHPASQVVEQLDRLGVADRMRSSPKARFVVTQEAGQIVVKTWPHAE
jgi:hypothetical protein